MSDLAASRRTGIVQVVHCALPPRLERVAPQRIPHRHHVVLEGCEQLRAVKAAVLEAHERVEDIQVEGCRAAEGAAPVHIGSCRNQQSRALDYFFHLQDTACSEVQKEAIIKSV